MYTNYCKYSVTNNANIVRFYHYAINSNLNPVIISCVLIIFETLIIINLLSL